jgi:hypothetical protein
MYDRLFQAALTRRTRYRPASLTKEEDDLEGEGGKEEEGEAR